MLVLHDVKLNIYHETYLLIFVTPRPIHLYPALVEVIMLVCWASLRSAPAYKNTLPPLNSSLQSAACYLRFGTDLAHG